MIKQSIILLIFLFFKSISLENHIWKSLVYEEIMPEPNVLRRRFTYFSFKFKTVTQTPNKGCGLKVFGLWFFWIRLQSCFANCEPESNPGVKRNFWLHAMYTCTAEMSTDQDWIGLDQDWSQFWPDQDWIGLQFFSKLVDQDWIGLRKFCMF